MALLDEYDINRLLGELPQWSRDGEEIVRTTEAASFLDGLDVVRAVGEAAELADHHPDIDIRWRTLTFRLSTHSEGGLTEADFTMARRIERLLG